MPPKPWKIPSSCSGQRKWAPRTSKQTHWHLDAQSMLILLEAKGRVGDRSTCLGLGSSLYMGPVVRKNEEMVGISLELQFYRITVLLKTFQPPLCDSQDKPNLLLGLAFHSLRLQVLTLWSRAKGSHLPSDSSASSLLLYLFSLLCSPWPSWRLHSTVLQLPTSDQLLKS